MIESNNLFLSRSKPRQVDTVKSFLNSSVLVNSNLRIFGSSIHLFPIDDTLKDMVEDVTSVHGIGIQFLVDPENFTTFTDVVFKIIVVAFVGELSKACFG